MLLAGDVGGTKTLLALYREQSDPTHPVARASFPSADFSCLEDIVERFLRDAAATGGTPELSAAAFGVAGPVIHDAAAITNLPWTITRSELADALRLLPDRVRLLNDLEATANAVPRLQPDDLAEINAGVPEPGSPIAVIAPGTGLGQAWLTWDGTAYRPHPSEGGHVDFAPCNQQQLDLLNSLYRQYDHVSFERVVSGQGIPAIYGFLLSTGRATEPPDLAAELESAADPTRVIMARRHDVDICRQTLDIFVAILGAKCGNVALSLMARGGVFLGGGIPPRIVPELQSVNFLGPFLNKGRFSEMMSRIPVSVILNSDTALLGAAWAARAV